MALTNCLWAKQGVQNAQPRSVQVNEQSSAAGTRFAQQLTNLNEQRLAQVMPRTPIQFLRGGKDSQR